VSASAAERIADLLRVQARYCRVIGSPLYAHLLDRSAEDVLGGGRIWDVLEGREVEPPLSMLPLRFLGAIHRAVLRGEAPELARYYPSAGGSVDLEHVWPAFHSTVDRLRAQLRTEVEAPVQTNEVARSAALLGGFLLVARDTGLPLQVLEVGASAGLLLRWDSYLYRAREASWGPPGSRVSFDDFLASGSFPFGVEATVASRAGCDAAPLDPRSDRDSITLRGFVWPDQVERFEALTAALELARSQPVEVEQADAGAWCERRLEAPASGVATVLYHSLVLQYLSDDSRERMLAAIELRGEAATAEAPFAWLRMELGGDEADVRLTRWPGGEERLVARAHYHGRPVRWLATNGPADLR
jgi:hypothetical protein